MFSNPFVEFSKKLKLPTYKDYEGDARIWAIAEGWGWTWGQLKSACPASMPQVHWEVMDVLVHWSTSSEVHKSIFSSICQANSNLDGHMQIFCNLFIYVFINDEWLKWKV